MTRVVVDGRTLEIEHRLVAGPGDSTDRPLLILLHEGLGSVASWKDFPERLCAACGVAGLVYSRPGYGRSTPRAPDEHWGPDYLHREANRVLPALLDTLGIDGRYLLFGHSDGGSIALIHAAAQPARLAGLVAMAPHIDVEEMALEGIRRAGRAYRDLGLRERLAQFHADVDSAFWGWHDAWLSPAFHGWNLRAELARIRCPVLAIQGVGDRYGTMRQIDGIAAAVPSTELLKLDPCGHEPQRDQPEAVIRATRAFVAAAL